MKQRQNVIEPLRTTVDDYGYVAQNFDPVMKLHDGDLVSKNSTGRWHVGGVFPESLAQQLTASKFYEQNIFIIGSTMPDVTFSKYETVGTFGTHNCSIP